METQGQTKNLFVLLQLGILGVLVLAVILRAARRDSSSNFAVREADREPRKDAKRPGGGSSPALGHTQDKASEKPERARPAQLEGIRLDAPPHVILGVALDASRSEIQKAYRDQMKRYHPDLVGRPGSREWQDAQRIAEAINRAKDEMLKRTRL